MDVSCIVYGCLKNKLSGGCEQCEKKKSKKSQTLSRFVTILYALEFTRGPIPETSYTKS